MPSKKPAPKSTSRPVAKKAAQLLQADETSAEVKSVAASALAQVDATETTTAPDDEVYAASYVTVTAEGLPIYEPPPPPAEDDLWIVAVTQERDALVLENATLRAELAQARAELQAQLDWRKTLPR